MSGSQGVMIHIGQSLGVPSSDNTLLMGDARQDLGRDLYRSLERVVNENGWREEYWILVHAKRDPVRQGVIRERIIICPATPPKMLGTMCWHIDNRTGRAERLWVLPLDIPTLIQPEGNPVMEIEQAAKGLPIFYG